MRNAIKGLFANEETMVDSVIALSILAMLGLLLFEGWKIWHDPSSFDPTSFGTAVATIVGAGGAVKTCRERFKQ